MTTANTNTNAEALTSYYRVMCKAREHMAADIEHFTMDDVRAMNAACQYVQTQMLAARRNEEGLL